MKVCVLQPDYSTSGVDYKNYDPPRDLTPFLPGHVVHHEFLNKLSTYKQLQRLSREGFDIFVNLCDGYLEWDIPSIDVINSLEALGLPFTGPTSAIYHVPKTLMKYVAHTAGVATPMHALIDGGALLDLVRDSGDPTVAEAPLDREVRHLRFPLFVKPAHAGDSLGVDEHAIVHDLAELRHQVLAIAGDWPSVLVEEYIDGREYTVLMYGDPEAVGKGTPLTPVEYIFPPGFTYKSYALKTRELHPEANQPVRDPALAERLKAAAIAVFRAFNGVGYARMDFRMDASGTLFFLENNFTCSVFYPDGQEGSADHILKFDGIGRQGFLERIIEEGIARHRRTQRPFVMRGNAIAGYGIIATRQIRTGEVVFHGEGRAQRLVTRRHVETRWSEGDKQLFRQYAYPLSDEVFAIWDEDPMNWAPQNHSCDANTGFVGLDIVARRDIARGEELTLDYAELLNEEGEPFTCRCGAANCRGVVQGTPGSSVTAREGEAAR